MKPFRGTTFFGDGLSARQPVEGTVPRGFLRADREFFTGKKIGTATCAGTCRRRPQVRNPAARHCNQEQTLIQTTLILFRFQSLKRRVKRGRGALRHLLFSVSRSDRQRRRHDCATWFPSRRFIS